jgi:hypothetical protein
VTLARMTIITGQPAYPDEDAPQLAHPKPLTRTYHLTRALDGDGNHIGWLIRQGSEDGPVLERFERGDKARRTARFRLVMLRAGVSDETITLAEMDLLHFLQSSRQISVLEGDTPHAGIAGCLAKGWIYLNEPYSNAFRQIYRLTGEGRRTINRYFPERA